MKIIIDVTQLVHWQGRLTGIPRVIQELSVRFDEDPELQACFVSWVKETGRFCEVDLKSCIDKRGKGIVYKEQFNIKDSPQSAPTSGSSILLAKKLAKRSLKVVGKVNKKVAAKVQNRLHAVAAQGIPEIAFAPDDILFIPHGEWWDEGYIGRVEHLKREGVKVHQLIHDMLPIVTPQYSGHATQSFTAYCTRVLPISDLVIAISESTKRDVINWMTVQKMSTPKVVVFREGEDFYFAKSTQPTDSKFTKSELKGNDYIVCVGTIEARKNHTLLYYVYKQAAADGIALPKLVVVGRPGWKTENIIDIIQTDPDTKDQILLLTDVSDGELSWLYDHCMFSIYPSFYEGWGLPIAESLSRGVPCIASNTSSMIEIAPGITSHFSPASTSECLAVIERMVDKSVLKKARQEAQGFKKTTWDDSYKQLKSLIIQC